MPKYIPSLGMTFADSFETSLIAGEKLFASEPVYLGSDGKVYACDAARSTKIGFIGFVKSDVNEGENVSVVFQGLANLFSGLTIASDYYLQDFTYTQDLMVGSTSSIARQLSYSPWQSFTATFSYLNRLGLYFQASAAGTYSFTVKIYSGEGIGGTLLYQENFSVSLTTSWSWYYFSLSKRIPLIIGNLYTICLTGNANHGWGLDTTDPYAYGRSDYSQTSDYWFQIFHDNKATIGTTPGTNSVKVGKAWTSTKIKI
jgi:hypothetical protein